MLKIANVSSFQISLAVFLPKIVWIGLQFAVGKVIAIIKKWHVFETQCINTPPRALPLEYVEKWHNMI